MIQIQWFPGHMNKARKALQELISEIDVVIEVLDARAPFSSCNPLLQHIIKNKKIIKLLNKSDLADPERNKEWVEYFRKNNPNQVAILGCKDNGAQKAKIIKQCHELAPNRNSYEKPLRVMITGIPNVGKSTLINQLIGKKSAKTGDVPAVTKANQCLIVNDSFLIYDTPGMMWQRIAYPQIGYNLAVCNSIGRNAIDEESISLYLIDYLQQYYPMFLHNRFKLKPQDLQLKSDELFLAIAKKRGCILQGGIIDKQKAAEIIIQEFRDGKIGAISLETPQQWQQWIEDFITTQQKIESLVNEDESTEDQLS